jgi:hypothetical protein
MIYEKEAEIHNHQGMVQCVAEREGRKGHKMKSVRHLHTRVTDIGPTVTYSSRDVSCDES